MSLTRITPLVTGRILRGLLLVTAVFAFFGLITSQLLAAPASPDGEGTTIFTFSGTLNPGDTLPIPLNRTQITPANYQIVVTGADSAVMVNVVHNGDPVISGEALGGETFWATGNLGVGNNIINITSTGAQPANFQLTIRTLPTTSYTWQGVANEGGEDSQIRLVFPTSGLYRFNFTTSGGAYKFDLNDGALQRQVETDNTAAFFVEAGTYPMTIQRTSGESVAWSVEVLPVADAPFDTLPYAKEGSNISTEILPISLADAAQVNMVIMPSGTMPGDTINIEVLAPDNSVLYTGYALVDEVFWGTFDLPAGNSRIVLTAAGDNMGNVDYDLTVDNLPTADYLWGGNANNFGQNSHVRVIFSESGLYTFDFGLVAGRFQFVVNEEFIQKTAETSNDDVTYYIPAGTHDLYIRQGQAGAEDWQVDISLESATPNSLPFSKNGGLLGGTGNVFGEEWLPIALSAPATVNLSIETTGATAESLMIHVYQAGAETPSYTVTQVLGTEKLWANFELSAGINLIHIMADGANAEGMTYDFTLYAAPTNGTLAWDGNALAAGLNSAVLVDFPSTGTYRFEVTADPGFANLVIDDAMPAVKDTFVTPLGLVSTSYDIEVTAGEHEVYVVQDDNFAQTTWAATVAPVTAVANFFTFEGTLPSGESITPLYTVPGGGTREFNYELTVSGGDVDLLIVDGNSATVADVTAYDGETLWGTGRLSGQNGLTLSNPSGSDIEVTLNLYDIPTASYDWAGIADGRNVAENSHIRVNFPSSALYTFNATNNDGRYQFVVQAGGDGPEVVRKTVESNLSVSYFLPAGVHDLFIVQDRDLANPAAGLGADWALSIGNPGAANDSLTYTKMGGEFGHSGVDDFEQEWLTINLAEASSVNLRTIATGSLATDALQITVLNLNGDTLVESTVMVSETHWDSFDLPAGLHLIHVEGMGNAGNLSYDIALSAVPFAPYNWVGIADGPNGEVSYARVTFQTSGLYTFAFDNNGGRYQFVINDEFIQKTVEMDDEVTLFVPAGTHDLYIVQDPSTGADWGVNISAVGAPNDSLPYIKQGGELGANVFMDEWLPISVGETTAVNMVITATGSTDDLLEVAIVNGLTGATSTLNAGRIYGTETFWATFDLSPADRLHLVADEANTAALSYELAIHALPDAPYNWSGNSLGKGMFSLTRMDFEANGIYRVELRVFQGLAIFEVDPALGDVANQPLSITSGYTTAITTSLTSGVHSFIVQQQAVAPETTWEMRVVLISAQTPTVVEVSPNSKKVGEVQTVNVTGTDFQTGALVELVNGAERYELASQTSSDTLLVVTADTDIPVGLYDVVVTNPDSQVAMLSEAYTVTQDDEPTITAVNPAEKVVYESTAVDITGTGFQAGATVVLTNGEDSYTLTVTNQTSTSLTATAGSNIPVGTYDVVVTNTDDQSATATDAFSVVPGTLFLPLITNGAP